MPHPSQAASAAALFDGDGYARKRGGNLFGDASTSDGQMLAPDLKAFEDEVCCLELKLAISN